ncbi:hypothetical protein OSB04_007243 [Centaurea solstitialis]|uniref:Uncharacterized protein n=1 Tax=Centaurea solstitialis TaxID=347529 RepID=A0AA38TS52_9ASTR|nr:hypothetical protein OSB04_007243 [Centaurea solstitialis]
MHMLNHALGYYYTKRYKGHSQQTEKSPKCCRINVPSSNGYDDRVIDTDRDRVRLELKYLPTFIHHHSLLSKRKKFGLLGNNHQARMRTIRVLYGSGFDTMNACRIIVHINCCTPSTSCTSFHQKNIDDSSSIGYAHQFTYIYMGDAILHATLLISFRPTTSQPIMHTICANCAPPAHQNGSLKTIKYIYVGYESPTFIR